MSCLVNCAHNMASCSESGIVVVVYTFSLLLTEAHECPRGYYGAGCDETCGHCIGGHVHCDVFDGFCANGCSPGFMGSTCHTACPPTFYGHNCQRECPPNCNDPGCNPVSGECSSNGCKPGFRGKFCSEACPKNTYGEGCRHACSCPLCGCNHVSGACYKECKQRRTVPQVEELSTQKPVLISEELSEKQTRYLCQEMERSFQAIISKVSEVQPVPLWPLVVICFLILVVLAKQWDRQVKYADDLHNCQQKWDKPFLEQIYGKEAAEEAAVEATDKATTDGVSKRRTSETAKPEQTT